MLIAGVGLLIVSICIAIVQVRAFTYGVFVRCPHCDEDINLKSAWQCGWCGHMEENDDNMKLAFPVEDCLQKSCAKKQSAVQCPHCGHDVILDEATYQSTATYGSKNSGVAMLS